MKVLLTGADGYIGRALARRLAAPGATLQGRAIELLTLCDLQLPQAPQAPTDPRVVRVAGSIANADVLAAATRVRPDVVFHLASVPSGQAEAQYTLGLDVNVHATMALVAALQGPTAPTLVFTSSIAVFGAPLPDRIDDDTPLRPALSYGAAKQMMEIFLADATRRGGVQARTLRLPGIVARPPTPTGALSAFSSALIRALVQRATYTCPVSPEATLWLLSLDACLDNLLHAANAPADQLGEQPVWTSPAQRVSIGALVQAFDAADPGAAAGIRYAPQPALEAQFGRLPPLTTTRADAAGFRHDGDLATLVRRAAAALTGTAV
jgi:nucleoside-diphosphate-sugar epimerase